MASYVNDLWPNFFPDGGAGLPRVGPFQNGSDLYLFFRYRVLDHPPWGWSIFIAAWKSTDGGVTWAEVDAVNRPECNAPTGDFYECVQVGTIVRIIFNPDNVPSSPWGRLGIIDFDMVLDVWGSLPVVYGPNVEKTWFGSSLAGALRSDGSLIIAYGDYGAVPDWDYRVRVVDWSVAGGWGTPQTVLTSPVNNMYLIDAVLGPGDRFHIFGFIYDVLTTYHRSLSSAGVLAAQQTILAGPDNSGYSFSVRAIALASGKMYLPYIPNTEDSLRVLYTDSAEEPVWATELVTSVMPCVLQEENSVGGAVVNGSPHLFWVKAAGGDPRFPDGLYYSRRNGSWGADQLIEAMGELPMPGLVAPSGAYLFWWNGATPEGWYYGTISAGGARYYALP